MSIRIRTKLVDPSLPGSLKTTVFATGYPNNVTDVPIDVYGEKISEFSSDTVTPNWRQLMKDGIIINNDCTIIRGKLSPKVAPFSDENRATNLSSGSTSGISHSRTVWSYRGWEPGIGVPLIHKIGAIDYGVEALVHYPPKQDLRLAGNAVLMSAYAEAASSSALALVSLAEARKTLASADRLRTLVPRFREWLKSNPLRSGRMRRITRDTASQWLEYRYGFMQLYYDFQSYSEVWKRIGRTGRVRFAKVNSLSNSSVSDAAWFEDPYSTGRRASAKYRTDVIRAGLLVSPRPNWQNALSELGLNAPFQTIWELIPMSFIVDWFVNMSTLMAAFDGIIFRDVLASWISRSSRLSGQFHFFYEGKTFDQGGYRYTGSFEPELWSQTEMITEYVRTANPKPVFLPEVRLNLNWKKFADLASLLRQLPKW